MIDIVGKFKTQATTLGYTLIYGARAFLNYDLQGKDLTDGAVIVALFPLIDTGIGLPHGNRVTRLSTSTTIWLGKKFDTDIDGDPTGVKSELDETYQQKYDRRLFDMKQLMLTYVNAILCGSNIELVSFRMSEQINQTDENIDFITCDITLEHEVDN